MATRRRDDKYLRRPPAGLPILIKNIAAGPRRTSDPSPICGRKIASITGAIVIRTHNGRIGVSENSPRGGQRFTVEGCDPSARHGHSCKAAHAV